MALRRTCDTPLTGAKQTKILDHHMTSLDNGELIFKNSELSDMFRLKSRGLESCEISRYDIFLSIEVGPSYLHNVTQIVDLAITTNDTLSENDDIDILISFLMSNTKTEAPVV